MLTPVLLLVTMALAPLAAQESSSEIGVAVPVTIGGSGMYSRRFQLSDPSNSRLDGGFRILLQPNVKLGGNWFGSAVVQLLENPYSYYDAFSPARYFDARPIQAFLGYSIRKNGITAVIKGGRLVSAFGSFPVRYDDALNPLIDQPLSYVQRATLRSDQLPCGVADLKRQFYGSVGHFCGGGPGRAGGLTPVTIYGLPGIQAEMSAGRVDARLQLTSGSPASPDHLDTPLQYLQWAGGGGFTIRQGLRVGLSGFRGPYLDRGLANLLPAGTGLRDYPASGLGFDGQWARGRWSVLGEWQRFWYASPNFTVAPSITSYYVEAKGVITPRWYAAVRAGRFDPRYVADRQGVTADRFATYLDTYEIATGWWINRNQLLKGSYSWLRAQGAVGNRLDVAGIQLVTTIRSLSWAIR